MAPTFQQLALDLLTEVRSDVKAQAGRLSDLEHAVKNLAEAHQERSKLHQDRRGYLESGALTASISGVVALISTHLAEIAHAFGGH